MRTLGFRLIASVVAMAMAFETCSTGLFAGAAEIAAILKRRAASPPPPFTEEPGPVWFGTNPRRDVATRAGGWTLRNLQHLDSVIPLWRRQRQSEPEQAQARPAISLYPQIFPFGAARIGTATVAPVKAATAPVSMPAQVGGPDGSGFMPGEGDLPGGGFDGAGTVNSHTGNRVHRVDIVSWPIHGGMHLGLTLFHNNQTPYSQDWGPKWSTNFDARVDYTVNSTASVRWGDGLTIPYSQTGISNFTAPAGIYDKLYYLSSEDRFYVITKDQVRYEFYDKESPNTYHLSAIKDRNGNTIVIN
jgi:hypothetical protein